VFVLSLAGRLCPALGTHAIIARGAPKKMGTGWMLLLAAVQAVAYLSYGYVALKVACLSCARGRRSCTEALLGGDSDESNRSRLHALGTVKALKLLARVAMPKQVRLQMDKALRMASLQGEAPAPCEAPAPSSKGGDAGTGGAPKRQDASPAPRQIAESSAPHN
jgi:hypothetical protein